MEILGNLIENSICLLIAVCKTYIEYLLIDFKRAFSAHNVLLFSLSNGACIQCIVAALWLLSVTIYAKREANHTESHCIHTVSLLRVHLPVVLVSNVIILSILPVPSMEKQLPFLENMTRDPVSLAQFTQNLVAYRLLYDIFFYCGHRLLHTNLLYPLHATHHQHRLPTLATNYQFSCVDLFVEGILPAMCAGTVLQCTTHTFGYMQATLFAVYVEWYQIGSHSSKSMPVFSALPPLSLIYNGVLLPLKTKEMREHDLVRFHTKHHKTVRLNFGITPWIDWLLAPPKGRMPPP